MITHARMIIGHERRIENNTQRYEEVDKRVHYEQFHEVSEPLPATATLPVKEQLL